MTARMDARPWLAHTQHDYAHMRLARGKPGDGDRARELLADSVAAFKKLGIRR